MFRRLPLLIASAALVLAACGGGETDTATTGATAGNGGTTANTGSSSGPETGTGSPADGGVLDFQAMTVDGSAIDMGSYAGTDLVVWFWAPW